MKKFMMFLVMMVVASVSFGQTPVPDPLFTPPQPPFTCVQPPPTIYIADDLPIS